MVRSPGLFSVNNKQSVLKNRIFRFTVAFGPGPIEDINITGAPYFLLKIIFTRYKKCPSSEILFLDEFINKIILYHRIINYSILYRIILFCKSYTIYIVDEPMSMLCLLLSVLNMGNAKSFIVLFI